MPPYPPLHQSLNVYISSDAYVLEPVVAASQGGEKKAGGDTLVVNRLSGEIALNPPNLSAPVAHENVLTVFGILGIISLATTDYLILITHRLPVCRFLGHEISLATSFRLLPIAPPSSAAASAANPVESHLLKLVSQGLESSQLFFSYGYDLTNSLERQQKGEEGTISERADDRFFWNKGLCVRFLEDSELSRFALPVIYGSFEFRQASLSPSQPFLFALISRRSRYRPGTRFFTRGIDHDGHTANFVETEQVILIDQPGGGGEKSGGSQQMYSFVQIRGSAPIFWAQINNLRYTPDLQIMDLPETSSALKSHLEDQIETYGDITLVNLVNQVKYERPVKEAFENAMLVVNEPRAKYVYFDFHKECKGMRFDRVSGLVDELKGQLEGESWFECSASPEDVQSGRLPSPRRTQSSVIRTNCMDSLDRTNVVQSALAKQVLNNQLRAAGLLNSNDTIEDYPSFMHTFRNVWADHANVVSTAYSGTGALKTDFTRTGKRTKFGSLQDGYNSVMRYLKNNYFDGSRQDALDLLTGSFSVRKGTSTPLVDSRPFVMKSMPMILALAVSLNICSLLASSYWELPIKWLFLAFWSIVAVLSFAYIWENGVHYVDYPRLNPRSDTLSYTGPGFYTPRRGRGKLIPFLAAANPSQHVSRKVSVAPALSSHEQRVGGHGSGLSLGGGEQFGVGGGLVGDAALRRKTAVQGKGGRMD